MGTGYGWCTRGESPLHRLAIPPSPVPRSPFFTPLSPWCCSGLESSSWCVAGYVTAGGGRGARGEDLGYRRGESRRGSGWCPCLIVCVVCWDDFIPLKKCVWMGYGMGCKSTAKDDWCERKRGVMSLGREPTVLPYNTENTYTCCSTCWDFLLVLQPVSGQSAHVGEEGRLNRPRSRSMWMREVDKDPSGDSGQGRHRRCRRPGLWLETRNFVYRSRARGNECQSPDISPGVCVSCAPLPPILFG